MKRMILIFGVICLGMLIPITSNAQEVNEGIMVSSGMNMNVNGDIVDEGYTEDGIYYIAYKVYDSANAQVNGAAYQVTIKYQYAGIVQPAQSKYYKEKKNGEYYAGTIYLSGVTTSSGNTVATYRGTLYPVQ